LPADAVPALAGETALAPGGCQVASLVFSAWDSATRNAATAVVNNGGGSSPPAPPAPCPVISQVIAAVVWNAPPGCPALELVQVCPQSGDADAGLSALVYGEHLTAAMPSASTQAATASRFRRRTPPEYLLGDRCHAFVFP
jgi:hypothetical protein